MKKKFLAVLSIVFMFALVLFGCTSIHLSGGPSSTDTVYGNGGSAVVKGDYLYFANAFVDYATLGNKDNAYDKNSKYTMYGIYRTKLNSEGKVDVDSEGVPTKADILTFNIGGYEYAGLYIFGNYLYYTTPFTNETNGAEAKTGRMRVERVSLDGTVHDIVCKFEDYTSDCSYEMMYIDGNVFVVYKTKDKEIKLVSVDSRKNVKTSTVASSIESYAVFEQKDIDKDNDVASINRYVYYVVKENSSDYVLYRTNLLTKEKEVFYRGTTSEIVLKEVKNNLVYYTEGGYLFAKGENVEPEKCFDLSTSSSDSSMAYVSDYLVLEENVNGKKGFVAVVVSDSKYYVNYYNRGTVKEIELVDDNSKDVTLVAVSGDKLFYQIADDNALYRCELDFEYNYNIGGWTLGGFTTSTVATNFSYKINEKEMLDFDEKRFYVYEQLSGTDVSYLTMYMADSDVAFRNDSGELVGQYIGNK